MTTSACWSIMPLNFSFFIYPSLIVHFLKYWKPFIEILSFLSTKLNKVYCFRQILLNYWIYQLIISQHSLNWGLIPAKKRYYFLWMMFFFLCTYFDSKFLIKSIWCKPMAIDSLLYFYPKIDALIEFNYQKWWILSYFLNCLVLNFYLFFLDIRFSISKT